MGCCRTFAARCESFSPCQDADTNHSRFLQSCGAMPNLGYKPLNRTWAKLEILFGLTAAGIGLLLGNWAPHATQSGCCCYSAVRWRYSSLAVILQWRDIAVTYISHSTSKRNYCSKPSIT